MDCPKCGMKSGVYNGYGENGRYVRRRKCTVCGYRFITVERVIDQMIQGNGKHGGKRVPIITSEQMGCERD